MVQRTSQELQVSTGQGVQAQQSGVGYAVPDSQKFSTSQSIQMESTAESAASRTLQSILGVAGKLAEKKFQMGTEEAYLSGVAKAGIIQSEAELESNVFMRDWAKAGYRDTMGRLAATDNDTKIARDMLKMREQSPEKFQEYLAERRSELLPSLEGMSIQSRKAMFASTMMNERAAISKHSAEHAAFGWETQQKVLKTHFSNSVRKLNGAKVESPGVDSMKAYGDQLESTFMDSYQGIVMNDRIPSNKERGRLVQELGMYALETNNTQLVDMINNSVVTHSDGTKAPMASLMSWDESVALSKAYDASLKNTSHLRTREYGSRYVELMANMDNPEATPMTFDQANTFIDEGSRMYPDYITEAKRDAFMLKWHEGVGKKVSQTQMAKYFYEGNVAGAHSLGKTDQETADAWMATIGKTLSPEQAHAELIKVGITTGSDAAYSMAGKMQRSAVSQIMVNKDINPANAGMLFNSIQTIEAAVQSGQTGAMAQYLKHLEPDAQELVTGIRANMQEGMPAVEAVAAARKSMQDGAALSGPMKAEIAGKAAKDNAAMVATLEPQGWLGRGWNVVKSAMPLTSVDGIGVNAISVRKPWFDNPETYEAAMATSRFEVAKELDRITAQRPYASADSRWSMAVAAVSARTVKTEYGPVILPKGQNINQTFGVPASVDADRVGMALTELVAAKDGNNVAFQFGSTGELMYQERNIKTGELSQPKIIDPRTVNAVVQEQAARRVAETRVLHGEGTTETQTIDGRKMSVTFNGDNTAGVDNLWAYRARKDLVKHEGIRDSVYLDKKGNATGGVGILLNHAKDGPVKGAPVPDASGKFTPQQINESFKLKSNEAAVSATRMMKKLQMPPNEPAFRFLTSLAYQSGPGFASKSQYRPLVLAMHSRDKVAAQAALKASPVWEASSADRQQFYMDSLNSFIGK